MKIEQTTGRKVWRVEREVEGLLIAASLPQHPSYGHIELVGYGTGPKFILTRYQSGRPATAMFDRGIVSLWRLPLFEEAKELASAVAEWLLMFRTARMHEDDGIDAARFLEKCRARCAEIARYVGAREVFTRVSRHLESCVKRLSERDRRTLSNVCPVHGDLLPRNFLVGSNRKIYPVDFEGFGFRPFDPDLAHFRFRLEHLALRGPFARKRALAVWQSFLTAYVRSGAPPDTTYLFYLLHLLEGIARIWNPFHPFHLSRSTLKSWLRGVLWVRARMRWLRAIPADPARAFEHLYSRL